MDARAKAEEVFETIVERRKSLIEIPLNCSQGETGTLLYLTFVQDGITPSEFSDILQVSLPRIASILNSLESKQFIKKVTDSEDKRKTIIYITEMGKEIVFNKKKEMIDKITKIIERLDEEDINQYMRLAKKIGRIIEEVQE